jgi:hypothetical protein
MALLLPLIYSRPKRELEWDMHSVSCIFRPWLAQVGNCVNRSILRHARPDCIGTVTYAIRVPPNLQCQLATSR